MTETVCDRVADQPPRLRAFDDEGRDRGGISHLGVRSGPAPAYQLTTVDVRGTFCALANLSHWAALTEMCDPNDPVARRNACLLAIEIECIARQLRDALERQEGAPRG